MPKAEKGLAKTKSTTDVTEYVGKLFNFGVDVSDTPIYGCIPTQFPTLNNHVLGIGGLPRGRLLELASKTGIGKTTIMQCVSGFVQSQGMKVGWVPTEPLDKYYAIKSGMDVRKEAENPIAFFHTGDSNDMATKIKLAIAINFFDLIIVDSVQAINTPKFLDAFGNFTMNTDQSIAKFWGDFTRELEGGFRVKYGDSLVRSEIPVKILKDGKFLNDFTIHRLEDKKTCLVLINHLKEKKEMFYTTQYTTGGVSKDFRFSHRLFMNPAKGGVKRDKETGELIWQDIKVMGQKSKMGVQSGNSVILRRQNGVFTELDGTAVVDDTDLGEEEFNPEDAPAISV